MDNSLYETVVATMQEGLLVVDVGGKILGVNPAFGDMTGYASSELVGKPCTVLNCTGCEIYGLGVNQRFCALFEKGVVRNRRCEITARDGRTIHVIKSATVLHDEEGRVVSAVETLRDISEMVRQEEEIRSLRQSLYQEGCAAGVIGDSPLVRNLMALVGQAARSDAPVFIHGESGVGKELVARALHDMSPRAGGSFIKVNCASLNENLLESELFGHVRGAFTGATRDRVGRFEAASGGSLFLDEIGDISPAMQVKLLRVLESGEVERVGDHRPIPVDVRIITATNKDLEELVRRERFRADLFYRINVIPIHVRPLRERKEDIPLLAQSFIEKIAKRSGRRIMGLTAEAVELMMAYDWPGNVREMRNAIEYAFVICRGEWIGEGDLAPKVAAARPACSMVQGVSPRMSAARVGGGAAEEEVVRALQQTGGHRTEAARLLGISRVALWKRMKRFGLLKPPASSDRNSEPLAGPKGTV